MLRRLSCAALRACHTQPCATPPPLARWQPQERLAHDTRLLSVSSCGARGCFALAGWSGHAAPHEARSHAARRLAAAASPQLLPRAATSFVTCAAAAAAARLASPSAPPATAAPLAAPNGVAWLQALQVQASSPDRAILTALPRRALCAETGLALRDLRVVDPSFRGQLPAILVRRGAIVVALEHLKAVITAERVLLFDASSARVKQFVPELLRALATSGDADETHGHAGELADSASPQDAVHAEHAAAASSSAGAWPQDAVHAEHAAAASSSAGAWLGPADMPFEFRALGAVLDSVCTRLELRSRALAPEVQSVVSALQADAAAPGWGLQLVRLNTELARLAADVADVRESLEALLDDDDDLDAMYLSASGAPRGAAQHAEAEVLLEGFYRAVEESASEVEQLRDALRFTESYVRTALDAARNKLLRLDTLLTLGTLSLAAGGVVAAAFGMNIPNGLEDDPTAFASACAAAAGAAAAVFAGVAVSARHTLRAM
jgi:hypothetical protein